MLLKPINPSGNWQQISDKQNYRFKDVPTISGSNYCQEVIEETSFSLAVSDTVSVISDLELMIIKRKKLHRNLQKTC